MSSRPPIFLQTAHLHAFQVLFLTEPLDEVSISALKSYKGKDFVDVSKEDFELGKARANTNFLLASSLCEC